MSLAQLDVFSTQMAKEYFEDVSKALVYLELFLLCVMSCSSQLQRSCIGYMMDFPVGMNATQEEVMHYSIA